MDFWSSFIHKPEELYKSREAKLNLYNIDQWVNEIGIKNNMNILEIGCGSGVFCHNIKEFNKSLNMTGIDNDSELIKYAKKLAKEKNIECNFFIDDATNLHLSDCEFDLCFSFTVVDYIDIKKFLMEQYKVLKKGGVISILNIIPYKSLLKNEYSNLSTEEILLTQKLIRNSNYNNIINKIKEKKVSENKISEELLDCGFTNITYSKFNPNEKIIKCIGKKKYLYNQVNLGRLFALSRVDKCLTLNEQALNLCEVERIKVLINDRYDQKISEIDKNHINIHNNEISIIKAIKK